MGEFAATVSILANIPIDATKLRELFRYAADCQNAGLARSPPTENYGPVSLAFCQKFCKVIAESRDLNLVAVFLDKFLPHVDKKGEVIPLFADFVRSFGWYSVSTSLLGVINSLASESRMRSSLVLADALRDDPTACTALSAFAIQKARDVRPSYLASSNDLGLLWKHAMSCDNRQVFQDVEDLFKIIDAKLLGPVVNMLSKLVDISSSEEHRAGLVRLGSRRWQWLGDKIADIEKPFTWEIPVANFPDAKAISRFLGGQNPVLEIQGFQGTADARARAHLLRKKIKAPLEITAIESLQNSCVRIEKCGGVFAVRNKKMAEYKAEMGRLAELIILNKNIGDGGTTVTGRKRLREEEDDELEFM